MHDNKNKIGITGTFLAVEQRLKTYLMRFLVQQQDIEDTVQETFLRAYKAEKKSEIKFPKSFLFRVARNIALTEIKRKRKKMTMVVGDFDDLEVIGTGLTPEDEVEMEQLLDMLTEAMGNLPPKCRSVLVMRKIYGFSHKEIAQRMDISVKTVEKHLTKALQRCQLALTPEEEKKVRRPYQGKS